MDTKGNGKRKKKENANTLSLVHSLDAVSSRVPLLTKVIIEPASHIAIAADSFYPTFAEGHKSGGAAAGHTNARGLRGREVISGRKLAKNRRKLVSIRGTVSLINSVQRRCSPRWITATVLRKRPRVPDHSKKPRA